MNPVKKSMKPFWCCLLVAWAAWAQADEPKALPAAPETCTNPPAIWNGTNFFILPPTNRTALRNWYDAWRRSETNNTSFLRPGVYETRPYKMIVSVPEGIDEKMILNPARRTDQMPVQRPGLEFVPRTPQQPLVVPKPETK